MRRREDAGGGGAGPRGREEAGPLSFPGKAGRARHLRAAAAGSRGAAGAVLSRPQQPGQGRSPGARGGCRPWARTPHAARPVPARRGPRLRLQGRRCPPRTTQAGRLGLQPPVLTVPPGSPPHSHPRVSLPITALLSAPRSALSRRPGFNPQKTGCSGSAGARFGFRFPETRAPRRAGRDPRTQPGCPRPPARVPLPAAAPARPALARPLFALSVHARGQARVAFVPLRAETLAGTACETRSPEARTCCPGHVDVPGSLSRAATLGNYLTQCDMGVPIVPLLVIAEGSL